MVVKKLLISLKKTILIKKIKYKYKLFPFKLKKNIFDFIISLESIEHIEDDHTFIDTLVAALKPNGILILSTPNEEKQSLKINPNKFHYRHYITKDMIKKLENFDLKPISLYGQDVYTLNSEGKYTGLLADEDMELKQNYDGQFCIYVVQKGKNRCKI